jgi:hypothetical protein
MAQSDPHLFSGHWAARSGSRACAVSENLRQAAVVNWLKFAGWSLSYM